MKRNIIRTFFEIFFPILMLIIIFEVRKSFKIETLTFEAAEKNISNFISNHSILTSLDRDNGLEFNNPKNESLDDLIDFISEKMNLNDIDFEKKDFNDFNFSQHNISMYIEEYIKKMNKKTNTSDISNSYDISYLGIKIHVPPFYICSKNNSQKEERPKIASIGIPNEMKYRMYFDAEIYNTLSSIKNLDYSFRIDNNTFIDFETIEEMEKLIESEEYLKDKNNLICFGLKFFHDNKTNHYDYSLHFFDYDLIGKGGIDDIPAKEVFDKFQSGPDIYSYMKYQKGGYNYMMKIINEYILKKETGNKLATFSFGIFPMKYADYRIDNYGHYLGYVITIIIVIAYMSPLIIYVYRFVEEKETRIKEGMKIMGLGESEYFLSYFIQYTIISFFVSIINSLLLSEIFKIISWYYLFFLIILFSLNIFSLIYFFQSFIDKTKICIVLSLMIYFIMYCISLSCTNGKIPFLTKGLLSIFPIVCLNLGILEINKFSYHFRQFYYRDIFLKNNNYSLFFMYVMLIFDFFFYLFLGYYLNNVIPHTFGIKKSWYFLCTKSYWCLKKRKKFITIEDKKEDFKSRESIFLEKEKTDTIILKQKKNKNQLKINSSKFESEEIYKDKNINEIFKIRDLVKKFEDGKVAIKGVNLNFYKDEIFALLGHNGAGKTTFISILTGLYEATKGKAIYGGENILDSNNMDIFRRKLGICPQYDILFEDLTIREHLEIFSILKGVKSSKVEEEVNSILLDFQMMNFQEILVRNLSPGERRKLSVAISLIGGSEIIFLDEPSSGMDITSRRNLWEILKRQCDGKIIILTTHYMEEASALGKRIGIINEGTMKCIGSPLFLIENYGKYMSLNIIQENDADNDKIVNFVTSFANGIQYEILSEEILFRIPIKEEKSNNEIMKFNIPKFFQELDDNLKILRIKSYSVSMPTLEDVFLNVANEDNQTQNNQELIFDKNIDNLLFNTDLKDNYSKKEKFKNDFLICMKRRYLITIRDLKGFILEVLCPIFLLLFGLLISKIGIISKSKAKKIDINLTGKQIILYSSLNEKGYINYFENSKNVKFNEINNLVNQTNKDRRTSALNFIEKIYEINYPFENNKNQIIDTSSKDYIGYYSSILLFSDNYNRYEFIMILNSRVRHAIPIYCHYFLSSIIQKESLKRNKNVTISYTHSPMPITFDLKQQRAFENNLAIIFFIAIAFAIMPANFISLLVKERINNSKHLMRISGINILSYWIVNYIFEFIKYYFTAGICLILLKLFNFYRDYLYIFYLIYGPAMVSFTYALSFLFSNESNAQNAIILINFILGDLSSIIVLLLRALEYTRKTSRILQYILSLTPTFCFDFAYNILINKTLVFIFDFNDDDWINFKDNIMLKDWRLLLPLIIYCSLECVIYTIIFFIIENRQYSFKRSTRDSLISEINDINVQKEVERVNSLEDLFLPYQLTELNDFVPNDEKPTSIYENVVVRVKNLRKMYSSGCFKKRKPAINNLNFIIERGECFGLLGLNGAGKTTTFKCITQEIAPDNGEIYVFGKEINGNFNELSKKFGYCPQFGAIFENLTVYENLEFYARIKGIKRNLVENLVISMIKNMSLNSFTNKISGRLSGGNKRKLSVAISMIGNPPIILLDEPSTGMDPNARRFMWSVIHKILTKGRKSSVIMTTHSMEEAETLCKRMGIMVNGEFVCLGTADEIKEKYGYGFEVNVRVKPFPQIQQIELLGKYNLDINFKVNNMNINNILNTLGKPNYIDELKFGRLGERIVKNLNIKESINIGVLLNWIFFVENALKFIKVGKDYFEEIFLSEHIENNFLFKLKKGNNAKSIGFFFGLFDLKKNECNITEYSIQKTSLEQIFNKFAANQRKNIFDIKIDDCHYEKKGIFIDDNLFNKLID